MPVSEFPKPPVVVSLTPLLVEPASDPVEAGRVPKDRKEPQRIAGERLPRKGRGDAEIPQAAEREKTA